MSKLRIDDRQWLIYQEAPVTAGVLAMEVLALTVTGTLIAQDQDNVEMRGMGNLMLRWADARQRTMADGNKSEKAALELVTEILEWMGAEEEGERPDDALEQLHAVAFSFDSTLQGAGISGDGWVQKIARGEHGR